MNGDRTVIKAIRSLHNPLWRKQAMSDHSIEPLPIDARPIIGFPNYMIDPRGFVWSNRVYGSKFQRIGPWWRMKRKQSKRNRYWYVDLFAEVGKPQRRLVHLLVLAVFVGPKPEGMHGLHRDDNRTNADLTNLYYGTQSQNMADALRNGGMKVGEKSNRANLQNDQVREIRRLYKDGMKPRHIAPLFNLKRGYIARICCGEIWKHV